MKKKFENKLIGNYYLPTSVSSCDKGKALLFNEGETSGVLSCGVVALRGNKDFMIISEKCEKAEVCFKKVEIGKDKKEQDVEIINEGKFTYLSESMPYDYSYNVED